MKLSAPIHVLKMQARELKKEKSITMVKALNLIANREGFNSWSLLQNKAGELLPNSFDELFDYLNPGDLILIGGRPGMRKTSLSIGLFVKAIKKNIAKNYFFTLSEVHKDIAGRIALYDENIGSMNENFELDYSNDICADYIINKIGNDVTKNSLIIIDYLQLLDQKRTNDPLQVQVEKLKEFVKKTGCIIVFLSQLNRNVEDRANKYPILEDILLPNPVELSLINKIVLLYIDLTIKTEAEIILLKPRQHKFFSKLVKDTIAFS